LAVRGVRRSEKLGVKKAEKGRVFENNRILVGQSRSERNGNAMKRGGEVRVNKKQIVGTLKYGLRGETSPNSP